MKYLMVFIAYCEIIHFNLSLNECVEFVLIDTKHKKYLINLKYSYIEVTETSAKLMHTLNNLKFIVFVKRFYFRKCFRLP